MNTKENELDFINAYASKIGEMSQKTEVSKHKQQYTDKIVQFMKQYETQFLSFSVMTEDNKRVFAEKLLLDEIREKNSHSQKLVGKDMFSVLFGKIAAYYKIFYTVLTTDYHIGKKTIVLNLDDTGDKKWGCIQEPSLSLGDTSRGTFALCGMWKKNR